MSCKRPNTERSNPRDVGALDEPLRSRIWTAIQDAPNDGLVLVSGLRDPGRQWDLRHERCRGRECDPSCKGYPVTAVPAKFINGQWVGGSRHQRGEAADMGGRDLDWLIRNRFKYGLGLTVKSENWHFEASGTDSRARVRIPNPTVRIIPYGGKEPAKPNPAPPKKKDGFLMALSDNQQGEVYDILKRLDSTVQRKDFVLRDRRDGRVWVFTGGGRYWIRNMDALSLMIFAGKIQGLGPEGIPNAPAGQVGFNMIDGVPEVATPTDVWEYQVSQDPSIAQ